MKADEKRSVKKPVSKKAKSDSPRPRSGKRRVTFEYVFQTARTVSLVGDFNAWDPHALPMKKTTRGLWKVITRLDPGTYHYKFVVDGQRWEEDPLNPNRLANDQGSCNSVLKVT